VARIRASVAAQPGLAVCGASYDGIGIPACIASARAAADQVIARLAGRARTATSSSAWASEPASAAQAPGPSLAAQVPGPSSAEADVP
jgi:oxygen-dependent protoporphyrinogen oxidase